MSNKVMINCVGGKFEYSDSFPHLPEIEFGLPFYVEVTGALDGDLKLDAFKLMKFDGYTWSQIEDLTLSEDDPADTSPKSIDFDAVTKESRAFRLWREGEQDYALANFSPSPPTPKWFEEDKVKTQISKRNSELASNDDKGPLQIWMTWTVTTAQGDTVTFHDPWVPKPPQG